MNSVQLFPGDGALQGLQNMAIPYKSAYEITVLVGWSCNEGSD